MNILIDSYGTALLHFKNAMFVFGVTNKPLYCYPI